MAIQRKTVTTLRLDAQLAYLDGRVKRAKALNKQADILAAAERAREDLYAAELRSDGECRLAVLRARVRQAERRIATAA